MGQPQGSFVFSPGHHLNWVVAGVFMAVAGLVALVVVIIGFTNFLRPQGKVAHFLTRMAMHELQGWGIHSGAIPDVELAEIKRQLARLNGCMQMGIGLGCMCGMAVVAWISFGAPGGVNSLFGQSSMLVAAVLYPMVALGATVGGIVGSRVVSQRAPGVVWADLRRRRASDYRFRWLGWGPFVLAAMALANLAIIVFTQQRISLDGYQRGATAPLMPIVGIVAVCAVGIPILAALLTRWVAQSPRLITLLAPSTARVVDEYRRAHLIVVITMNTWLACGMSLMGAVTMIPSTMTGQETWVFVAQIATFIIGGWGMFIALIALIIAWDRVRQRVAGSSMAPPTTPTTA